MKVAPLIYSRTFYCDFNSNFAVRPNNLDVHWAADKVLAAMKDLDIFNGVRRVVASKDGAGIAGVACTFKYFVENYLPDKVKVAEKYFRDEVRREVKIFLGYAFKPSGKREIPQVTDEDLLQMFLDKLAPEWERKFVETVYSDYDFDCDTKPFSDGGKNFEEINGVKVYKEDVFNQFLADAQVENLSYCSNVNQFDIWERGKYSIIFTSQNQVISKLKEAQKKTPSQDIPRKQDTIQPQRPRQNLMKKDNNSSTRLTIFAIGLIVIMAIIFLLTK